jgi:hypothetical protein
MTKATGLTPEQIIDAAREKKGVTKTHLAQVAGMETNNFIKALNNWRGQRLNDERRAKVAKELGIPEVIVNSWLSAQSIQEGAA